MNISNLIKRALGTEEHPRNKGKNLRGLPQKLRRCKACGGKPWVGWHYEQDENAASGWLDKGGVLVGCSECGTELNWPTKQEAVQGWNALNSDA